MGRDVSGINHRRVVGARRQRRTERVRFVTVDYLIAQVSAIGLMSSERGSWARSVSTSRLGNGRGRELPSIESAVSASRSPLSRPGESKWTDLRLGYTAPSSSSSPDRRRRSRDYNISLAVASGQRGKLGDA